MERIGYKKFFKYVVDQTNDLNANNIDGFINALSLNWLTGKNITKAVYFLEQTILPPKTNYFLQYKSHQKFQK